MKLKDILDNTDAPIFVRASLKNAVATQESQSSQSVGLLSETVFANDVVFDHNISYPEYYRPYRECSVDVITVDNYITDKITESNIPYLDVTIFFDTCTFKDLSSINMQNLIADTVRDSGVKRRSGRYPWESGKDGLNV